jgi:cell division septum initiation protein DivIVA
VFRKVNVDVHVKLAEIRQAVEQARSMPMSASVVMNRAELLEMLADLERTMDEAFDQAETIQRRREEIVADGRREAEHVVSDARNEREHLVSDTEVFRLVGAARVEADGLRKETDDYVDGKLANFEITLERTIEAVKRGRERLAGRSALDSLTEDEINSIKLPEHLEG